MKISVQSVDKLDPLLVNFESSIGNGSGRWASSIPPEPGTVYDVEFDIDSCLSQIVAKQASDELGIRQDGSEVVLAGKVDSIDEDGMAYIRLSKDCLIMIEAGSKSILKDDSIVLKFNSRLFEISAIGI